MAITRPTWVDGVTVLTKAFFDALVDAIEGWVADSYTPAMQGSTSNPTLSAAAGKYLQIGDAVLFRAKCTINGVGSGSYFVTLPVTADGTDGGIFQVAIRDASPANTYHGSAYLDSTSRCGLYMFSGTTTAISAVTHASPPITFAAGDIVTVTGFYFAA